MSKDSRRSVNILLCIAGVLCCIGSGFVSAPPGLLADDSVNIIQALQPSAMLIFYAVPSILMLLACILALAGRLDILSLLSLLIGGVLFAMMDFRFGVSRQTFAGILINMIGVILLAAGVTLQVFATETGPAKVSRKAAKRRNAEDFSYERRRRPAYDDIYMDYTDASGSAYVPAAEPGHVMSEADEYLALDALKAGEEEAEAAAEAARKAQQDEIQAMIAALSAGMEVNEEADADTETKAISIEESLAALSAESEVITEAAAATAMAHMAEALETPNQTMTDFYEGIEDIFLDADNSKDIR